MMARVRCDSFVLLVTKNAMIKVFYRLKEIKEEKEFNYFW